jgi:UDP-N-acetylglucosamine 2-epimerase (non-hydrolysing)
MRVVHVVGTRPNFMKVAPLIRALSEAGGAEQTLVHTGQHYDSSLSDAFFADLEMPYPDHFLGVGSGTHGQQTARVMLGLEPLLAESDPAAVVVPGDVNSTLAAAITAAKLDLPVVHVEAGLRSRDRSMPEEHNRIVADHVGDLLLTPSRDADANLVEEGIDPERIAFVGNLMIDSLRRHEEQARALDVARRDYGAEGYLLVTLHRPAVVDDPVELLRVMEVLEEVASTRPVLFPVHPRTARNLEDAGWNGRSVRLLEPQGYLRFLSLQMDAHVVLTDSGGVQEETTVLGVPCLTLRANTERPITIEQGSNRLLGVGPEALAEILPAIADPPAPVSSPPERWDGRAAERAAAELVARYGSG